MRDELFHTFMVFGCEGGGTGISGGRFVLVLQPWVPGPGGGEMVSHGSDRHPDQIRNPARLSRAGTSAPILRSGARVPVCS